MTLAVKAATLAAVSTHAKVYDSLFSFELTAIPNHLLQILNVIQVSRFFVWLHVLVTNVSCDMTVTEKQLIACMSNAVGRCFPTSGPQTPIGRGKVAGAHELVHLGRSGSKIFIDMTCAFYCLFEVSFHFYLTLLLCGVSIHHFKILI